MSHFSHLALTVLVLTAAPVFAQDPLHELPEPVASYAKQFDQECRTHGLGQVVVNENYSANNPGPKDVNGDGAPDYIIYKCMFGCSEKPFAFLGIGTPCPWGNLLMSNGGSYRKVFLPGMVSSIQAGPPVRISLHRPRELRLAGNFCKDPFPNFVPVQVYELKQERFQLVGTCPSSGACELIKAAGL